MDPRGRSPLPRRRRCTRPREAEDATGISLKGEPFLLPRPKKYPLQPPVTVDSTPTSVIDPAPPREQQQKSANPATVSANPSAKTPHRKFRTPKTAQKFPKKKHGSGGTSARGGKEQGKVVKASADPQVPTNDTLVLVSNMVLENRVPHQPGDLIESLLSKAPVASSVEDAVTLVASNLDAAPGHCLDSELAYDRPPPPARTSTVKATLSSTALPEEYLYTDDGPLASAKRPRCKGIWFIPEPNESQTDSVVSKDGVSRDSSRAYKSLQLHSFLCKLWPFSCHCCLLATATRPRSLPARGLSKDRHLLLAVHRERTIAGHYESEYT